MAGHGGQPDLQADERLLIRETGTVEAVEAGLALVRARRSSACRDCASAGFCEAGAAAHAVIRADNPLGAVPGQRVRVAVPASGLLGGGLLLYGLPLAGLFAGMAAGLWLAARRGAAGADLWGAAGALAGLLLALAFQRLVNARLARASRFRPRIVEILPDGPSAPVPGPSARSGS